VPVTVFRYGVQVGPRTVALAAWASKGLGLPAGKVARLLGQLGVTTARRLQRTYAALVCGAGRPGRRHG
jgi:hypothetical protein